MQTLTVIHAAQDGGAAAELTTQLHPDYLSALDLRWLQPGEDQASAAVLLVLVSPALDDAQRQLLHTARAAHRLLLPVPLRSTTAPPPALTGLQPILPETVYDAKRPDTPVAREPLWHQVALALPAAIGQHRRGPARGPAPTAPVVATDHRRPLYIDLVPDGASVTVRHLLLTSRGCEEIHRAHAPRPDPATTTGAALFDLFFPDEGWRHSLAALRRKAVVSPVHAPVALRVATSDPALRTLPLADLRWRDWDLRDHSWTFEWTAAPEPSPYDARPLDLWLPAQVLVLGAPPPAQLSSLLDALAAVLPRRHDGAIESAGLALHSAGEPAIRAFHGLPDGACDLLLHLGPAPGLPLLLNGLRHKPLVAYVDTPLSATERKALCAEVPVVLLPRPASPAPTAVPELLLRFLRRLPHSSDPVAAVYQAARQAARDGRPLWGRLPVVTTRGTVRVNAPRRPRLEDASWLKLDRSVQRSQVRRIIVEDLMPNRQVEAMVVLGQRGNHVEHFQRQLLDELSDPKGEPIDLLEPVFMGTPQRATDDARPLCQQLRVRAAESLAGDSEVPVGEALKARYPGGLEPQLLLLSYGTSECQNADDAATLLAEWLRFAEGLSPLPPGAERLRVLCYLALELPDEHHAALGRALDELSGLISTRFSYSALPPLTGITQRDLIHFLLDDKHCDCPPGQAHELKDLIMKRTRGNYEDTVALLRRAMDEVGWYALKAELLGEARS